MTDEEHMTAQLLRLAGGMPDPPADRAARVRDMVYREWCAIRRRRRMRRAAAGTVLLAAAACVAIVVWMNRPRLVTPPSIETILAVAERIQGEPLVRQAAGARADRRLTTSSPVRPDDTVTTDGTSRVALRTVDGTTVRIDRESRVRFLAPAVIEVLAGAAYVATADASHGFEIRTAMGSVHDIGTQFEVRVSETSLRLRVRAGAVEIRRGTRLTPAAAGTETTVTARGTTVRQIPAFGAEWAWTTDLAPPFAIDGRPLRAFLEHVAAEEGWTLRYADPAVADAAGRTILHGSVEGLRAEDALRVALATSGLEYRRQNGELLVLRPSAGR